MRLALTGGIGSGKSTVGALLVARGVCLVDTDAIARTLTTAGGAAMPALQAEFGPDIVATDGALARDAMRRLAFGDAGARQRLEVILHPMIGSEAARQAAQAAPGQSVVFDVPLLAESARVGRPAGGWRARVDKVLVIDCSEATQVERVARRPGWDAAMAQRVLTQQATRTQRRAVADAVIFNDGLSLPALADELADLGARWGLWNNPGSA